MYYLYAVIPCLVRMHVQLDLALVLLGFVTVVYRLLDCFCLRVCVGDLLYIVQQIS